MDEIEGAARRPSVRPARRLVSDDELLADSGEHLHYEIWMLERTAYRRLHDSTLHLDYLLKNAVVESFTVHARTLTEFLYPEGEKRRRDTDILSHDYVSDIHDWISARGEIPEMLKLVLTRSGKEIAHLTSERLTFNDPGKEWPLEAIVAALHSTLKLFAARATATRLHPHARAIINGLEPPMVASLTDVPNSTSTGISTRSVLAASILTDIRSRGPR